MDGDLDVGQKVWHTQSCQLAQGGWKEKPQVPSQCKAGTK